jgi:hypothetical protein
MFRTAILAASAALALSACTTAQTADGTASAASRDCFRALDVGGYGVLDDHRVRVHISPQREYILTIGQDVQNLDWTHAISIRSVTSFICVGNGLGVQLIGGDPPFPYQVTDIARAPREPVQGS